MRRVTDVGSLSEIVAFAGPLALYVASLLPGVAFWDTGEMQTVTNLLGIAHPTGFPLFVLGGWLFSHVIPFGSPAWRISLLCAFAAAGTAAQLARVVRALGCGTFVAVASAFAYAVGDIVWTRGSRADVHDVALFFVAFAVARALEAGRARDPRGACVAAFALGCGIATHPIAALAAPAVVVLAWPVCGVRAFACALLPLALYAYVPLRAYDVERRALDPVAALGIVGGAFWDYDAPSSPGSFARYLAGGAFDPGAAARAWRSSRGPARALDLARTVLAREYGVVGLALALTGGVFLVLRERRAACALATLAVGGVAFAANFAPESDPYRYALPALWSLGICAGLGASWVMAALVGEGSRAIGALACALLAMSLWPNALFAWRDVRHARSIDDASGFGCAIAARTPADALVVASWTYATPLAYDAYVMHAFGARTLVSAWPDQYVRRYGAWRVRFKDVYFVLAARYSVERYADRVYARDGWQLAKLRS